MLYFWLIPAVIYMLLAFKFYVGVRYFDHHRLGKTRDKNYFYDEGYGILIADIAVALCPILNFIAVIIFIIGILFENDGISDALTRPMLKEKENNDG